jgi:hypothetical protein
MMNPIPSTKTEIWFLAFCVEIYKAEKGISGQETYNYFDRTGAVDYIIDCADALHTTGPLYIIDSIDDYIANHAEEAATT